MVSVFIVAASPQPLQTSPAVACGRRVDNSVMLIKVAGQEYLVTNTLKSKSLSLSSLADNLDVKIERTKIFKNINNNDLRAADKMAEVQKGAARCDEVCVVESMATNIRRASRDSVRKNEAAGGSALAKSKSEGNPFGHKRQGKIIRVSQRGSS